MVREPHPDRRIHVTVGGRVQGVGFRWFVRETAGGLRVSGWVRNRTDGDVEIEAQGPDGRLAEFLAALRTHPYAKVERIESREIPARDEKADFYIR